MNFNLVQGQSDSKIVNWWQNYVIFVFLHCFFLQKIKKKSQEKLLRQVFNWKTCQGIFCLLFIPCELRCKQNLIEKSNVKHPLKLGMDFQILFQTNENITNVTFFWLNHIILSFVISSIQRWSANRHWNRRKISENSEKIRFNLNY